MRRRQFLLGGAGAAGISGLQLLGPTSARADCGAGGELLHRRIPAEQLERLQVYDQRFSEWRAAKPTESALAGAPLKVVHLWADWCRPCIAELPLVKRLAARISETSALRARLLCVAAIPNAPQMERFVKDNPKIMPAGPWYQDTGELLVRFSRAHLPGGREVLPLTLLLDERQIVRHAVIGAIEAQTLSLLDVLKRLTDQLSPP